MRTHLNKGSTIPRSRRARKRWIGAGLVLLLALAFIGIRSLEAPLILYPSSSSLPAGFYVRSLRSAAPGEIIAFSAPKKAGRHLVGDGQGSGAEPLLIKPLAAGPDDHVCNDFSAGLRINHRWIAPTASRDSRGQNLPVWEECRRLGPTEVFTVSTFVSNSFDSRYFGPIHLSSIKGVYRLAFR